MEIEFSQVVQREADSSGLEITSEVIWKLFSKEYLNINSPYTLTSFENLPISRKTDKEKINAEILYNGKTFKISETGNGPISAFVSAMKNTFNLKFTLADFGQNTMSSTSKAKALAYVELKSPDQNGKSFFGAGIDTSITIAPIKAIISALNKI